MENTTRPVFGVYDVSTFIWCQTDIDIFHWKVDAKILHSGDDGTKGSRGPR